MMTSLRRFQHTYRLDRRPYSSNLVKNIRQALRLEDQPLTSSPKVLEASSYEFYFGNGTLHWEKAQLSASVNFGQIAALCTGFGSSAYSYCGTDEYGLNTRASAFHTHL